MRFRDGTEELHAAAFGKPSKQVRVLALGQLGIVTRRSDDAKVSLVRECLDQAVDALVRREPPDEEDAAARGVALGREAIGVGASIDDARPGSGRAEVARRIRGHREEAVEEPREKTCPVAAGKAVVRDRRRQPADACVHRGEPARRASQMVRMDDVGARDGVTESERQRMRGMPCGEGKGAKDVDSEPARLAPRASRRPEAHELAVDAARKGAGELERVTLTPSEDPLGAEERRSDLDDPHLVLPLVTLGDPRRVSGGYLYHRRMADAAARHAARIVFLSVPEWPFPLPVVRGAALLRRAKELGASAVLLDSIAAAYAAPALAARRLDAPLVGVLHQPPGGIDHGSMRARAQGQLDRLAWRRAELLIAASDSLAEQLVKARFPRSRIRVVPPGRDVAPAPRDRVPDLRNGRGAAILTVANWLPRKGILELLEAFARLPADAATLHLAGDESVDPPYAARVRSRLADPDLAGRVVLHGRLAREDVAALYRAADVFALPAYREPYGTVWGEAAAFGLPVVGWRAGNLPYLADDEREALLVEPGDVAALSAALLRVASDEDTRATLGAAARRRALTRPTWEESAALFFSAIREVLPGGSGATGGPRERRT